VPHTKLKLLTSLNIGYPAGGLRGFAPARFCNFARADSGATDFPVRIRTWPRLARREARPTAPPVDITANDR
jgi:hypothetical protein